MEESNENAKSSSERLNTTLQSGFALIHPLMAQRQNTYQPASQQHYPPNMFGYQDNQFRVVTPVSDIPPITTYNNDA